MDPKIDTKTIMALMAMLKTSDAELVAVAKKRTKQILLSHYHNKTQLASEIGCGRRSLYRLIELYQACSPSDVSE